MIQNQNPDVKPDAMQDIALANIAKGLDELVKAGGTIYRSKHHGARQLRKRARLQKRLLKAGVIRKRPRRKAAA